MQKIGSHTYQPTIIELKRCKIKTKEFNHSKTSFGTKIKKMGVRHHLSAFVGKNFNITQNETTL